MTLISQIQNTQATLISVLSRVTESVDDREEQDMALDSIKQDVKYISDQISVEREAIPAARVFLEILKESNLNSMIRDLEFGIAYAER